MKRVLFFILILYLVGALIGCLPRDTQEPGDRPAGLFLGIWHGWIAPFSLIVGIFSPGVRIYEPYNSGWWYDFGFYIAIISGFGGISLTRKKAASRRQGSL